MHRVDILLSHLAKEATADKLLNSNSVSDSKESCHFETLAVQQRRHEPRLLQCINTPIVLSSTFTLDSTAHGAVLSTKNHSNSHSADKDGFIYSRWGNPTNQACAQVVSQLEGAKATFLFSSGMNAISSIFITLLRSGQHIVCQSLVYGGVREFLQHFAPKLGVEVTYVNGTHADDFKAAVRPNTAVLWSETPCNPSMRLCDLGALGQMVIDAGRRGQQLALVVDGTFATPYHQLSLAIPGVTVSVHSATKYLGGHSDILAGTVSSNNDDFIEHMGLSFKMLGGGLAAFDSFLLLQG